MWLILLSLMAVAPGAWAALPTASVQFTTDVYGRNENAGDAALTVLRTGDTNAGCSVNWSVTGGTATGGSDFSPVSGTLTFAAGETFKNISLLITDDLLVESNETVNLTLSGAVNATLGFPTNAVLTIFDNDVSNAPPVIQFVASVFGRFENQTAPLNVERLGDTNVSCSVEWAYTGGTAVPFSDFFGGSSTINFAAGQTIIALPISIIDDAVAELDETAGFILQNPVNATLGSPTSATLTIYDNDASNPPPASVVQFITDVYGRNENAGDASLTVTRSGNTSNACSVSWSVTGGGASSPADYSPTSGTLNFAAFETFKNISLLITDDALVESNETVHLTLSSPSNTAIGFPSNAVLTIFDNDVSNAPPATVVQFITDVYGRNENTGDASLTVTRSGNTSNACSVNWSVTGGSATAGADYSPSSGTLNFAAFETFRNIGLFVVDDLLVESNETVNLTLSSAVNATFGFPSNAVLTIFDNDTVPSAELQITKTASASFMPVGSNVVFNLTLRNNGPASVTNQLTVTEVIPPGFDYLGDNSAGSGAYYSFGQGQWVMPTGLLAGATQTVAITVRALTAGLYTNTALVNVPGGLNDPNTNNNASSAAVTVTNAPPPQADMSLFKTGPTGTVTLGSQITYTLLASNAGPNTSSNVVVRDAIPNGTVFVSASGGACTFYPNFQRVDCDVGHLASGSSAVVSVTVQVTGTGPIVNCANAYGSTTDANTTNNAHCTTNLAVTPPSDLAVGKSVNTNTVALGGFAQFYLTVTNLGTGAASNIIVIETLPTGLQAAGHALVNGGESYDTNSGLWFITNLAAGASTILNVTAELTLLGTHTNTVELDSTHPDDLNPLNNRATVAVTGVLPRADLAITKTVNTNALAVGGFFQFYLNVTNLGPNHASNIVVQETLPLGLQAAGSALLNGGEFYDSIFERWYITNLAAGAGSRLNITAQLSAAGLFTNTASLTSSQPGDTNAVNNSASVVVSNTVVQADLQITKTASTNAALVGQRVLFHLALRNNGPEAVLGAFNVSDLLPSGFQYVSNTASPGTIYSPGGNHWMILTGLAANATVTLDLTTRAITNGVFTNTASIELPPGVSDLATNNNSSSVVVTNTLFHGDLSVVKFLTGSNVNVLLGDTVSFTIIVSNAGPEAVRDVRVPDFPDAGLNPVFAFTGTNATYSFGWNEFTILSLAVGETATVEWRAEVTRTGLLTNRVAVLPPLGLDDTNAANNAASAYVSAVPSSDLQVIKTVNNTAAFTNQPLIFTIQLRNAGPHTSSNMVVRDLYPPGTTLTRSNVPAGTVLNPATGEWTVPRLTNSETTQLRLEFIRTTSGTVTNVAFVASSPNYDPTPNDRTNSVVVTWIPFSYADLRLSIALPANVVPLGETMQVQYAVTNAFVSEASNITVHAPLPPGVELVTVGPSPGWSYNPATAVWTSTNTLPVNIRSTFTYDLRVTNAGLKILTAQITASQPIDPYPSNNVATTNFIAGPVANITGFVMCTTNGPGVPGVTIAVTSTNGSSGQAVTGPDGAYNVAGLATGFYTITPSASGFVFAPASRTVNATGGATNLPPFLAIPRSITGVVRTGTNGSVLSGIAVELSGAASAILITDQNGAFNFTNLNAGDYTVTPLHDGVSYAEFAPTNTTFALGSLTNCGNSVTFFITNDVVVLRALEVVQVSQDWQNSVPLIAHKDTLVRAHLQLLGTNTDSVEVKGARLWATNLATMDSMSWWPRNGSVVVVSNNAALPPFRSNIHSTLNFIIPPGWREGLMDYHLEWEHGVLIPREPAEAGGTASNGSVRVSYTNMPNLEVRFIKVAWTNGAGVIATTNIPTEAQIIEQQKRVVSIYPIVQFKKLDGYFFWSATNGAPTNEGNLLASLNAARLTSTDTNGSATNRIWYGVAVNTPLRGLGYINGGAAHGVISTAPDNFQRQLAAHEIGHTLAREHAVHSSLGEWTNDAGMFIASTTTGRNREQAWNPVINFPMNPAAPRPGIWPTLGPMNNDDQFVWGYDHKLQQVISPYFTFDLMSYCHGDYNVPPKWSQWPWMSKYTYTNVQNSIINRYGPGGAPPPALHQPAKDFSPYMLLRGEINVAADTMRFLPSYPVPAGVLPAPAPGDYLLRLVDSIGQPLLEIPFAPDRPQMEFDYVPAFAHFNIEVPVLPAAVGAIVFHLGVPIGTIAASANAPVVQVIQPNGGEVFANTGIHATWSGSDLDGDALHYLLQFSADGGVQWTTIAIDWDGTALDIPPEVLAATSQGRLRVIASDGFRFSMDDSDGLFVILNHGPAVAILSPALGELFFGERSIVFSANANDLDDGALAGTNVVWRSDRDGLLGTDDLLLREVSTLSEGAHVITVTVTDSGGLTNSATVTINISHDKPPQLHIALNPPNTLLWWSSTATNYHLQRATSLPGAWSNVTNATQVVDDKVQVTLPASGPEKFFRLIKP